VGTGGNLKSEMACRFDILFILLILSKSAGWRCGQDEQDLQDEPCHSERRAFTFGRHRCFLRFQPSRPPVDPFFIRAGL
jgi:hypothetical protein